MIFGLIWPLHAIACHCYGVWDPSRGRGCSMHLSLARSVAAEILLTVTYVCCLCVSQWSTARGSWWTVKKQEQMVSYTWSWQMEEVGQIWSDGKRWKGYARSTFVAHQTGFARFYEQWNRILLSSRCCRCGFFAAFDHHSHRRMPCSRKKVGCSIRSPTGVSFVHHVVSARQGHLGNDRPSEWELRMHKFPSLQVFKIISMQFESFFFCDQKCWVWRPF